jgi:uncharacterized protein (TIGR03382 family)
VGRAAPLVALLAASSPAHADVTITFNTTPNGGELAPLNVVAAWIEVDQGPFVKTIGVYAGEEQINLIAWRLVAGPNDVDAILGPTRLDHLTPVTVTWNLRDKAGALVPDGKYRVRMEMADGIAQTTADNRQGAFIFTVSATPEMQTGLSSGGFENGTIDFQPVLCSNGRLDPGESCDSAIDGSCPAACPASGDVCAPNNLVGDAASCTAACQVLAITECVDNDGCCAPGCLIDQDSDCEGVDPNNVNGGCDAGGSNGLLVFAAFGLGVVLLRRRRA